MTDKPDLLFVSTRFLFPIDSGGKIRTTQVLRGMKGGPFRIVLVSPASAELVAKHRADLDRVCDHFEWWPAPVRGPLFPYLRLRHLLDKLPIPVRTDRHPKGITRIAELLRKKPAVAVFDFAHAAVLAPPAIPVPSVMFTHNVEAEIFKRHYEIARNPLVRAIWRNQYRKMFEFERSALRRFDVVVAVADRDGRQFSTDYEVAEPFVIPTGVDLEFFGYASPARDREVIFCGSMDWLANQEAVAFFMDDVWPEIARKVPDEFRIGLRIRT